MKDYQIEVKPQIFINNFNQILTENGMVNINIPQSVIESSKTTFLSNHPKGPSIYNPNPSPTTNPSTPIPNSNPSNRPSPIPTAFISTPTVSQSSTYSNSTSSQALLLL